jgi:hypothetical protein
MLSFPESSRNMREPGTKNIRPSTGHPQLPACIDCKRHIRVKADW